MTPSTLILLPALLSPQALADGDKDGQKNKKAAQSSTPVPKPRLTGLAQAWITAYDQDEDPTADPAGYGDPEDDPGLKLRRARIGMTGENKSLRYDIEVGMGSPYDDASAGAFVGQNGELGLVDASAGWAIFDELWIDVGLQKLPISREQLVSSTAIALGERSVGTSALIPQGGRDAGATLDYKSGGEDMRGRVRAGLYNGNGSELGDDNGGKLFAARAEGAMGPGAAYKTHGTVKNVTLSLAGDFWMGDDRATRQVGYGGDAMFRVSGLAITGEYRMATISPTNTDIDVPGVLSDTPRTGYMAQVGYTFGEFEPAVRYSAFDDHTEIDDNGDVSEVTAGFNWAHEDGGLRAGAHYIMRLEDAGRTIDNDTARLWLEIRI